VALPPEGLAEVGRGEPNGDEEGEEESEDEDEDAEDEDEDEEEEEEPPKRPPNAMLVCSTKRNEAEGVGRGDESLVCTISSNLRCT
jgi:hypothetical protein